MGHPMIGPFGWLTMFSGACSHYNKYAICDVGREFVVTVSDWTMPTLNDQTAYSWTAMTNDCNPGTDPCVGGNNWDSLIGQISVFSVGKPDASLPPLRMLLLNSLGGTWELYSAPNAWSQWHKAKTGTLSSCPVLKTAHCYALEGHWELDTASQLMVSYSAPSAQTSTDGNALSHLVVSTLSLP
jgi:hypothetical protein